MNGQAKVIAMFNRRNFLPGTQLFHLAVLMPAQTLGETVIARTGHYALRLLASVKAEAKKVAAEGTSLNQFIVAEKLAALRTAQYFQDRTSRADLPAFDRLLTRTGGGPPRPGDEIKGSALPVRPSQRRNLRLLARSKVGNGSRPRIIKSEPRSHR